VRPSATVDCVLVSDLLNAAGPHLGDVIVAAIECGMRRGEILSLRWQQVEKVAVESQKVVWSERAELVLAAKDTKTKTPRPYRFRSA
jgi:integrase